MSVVSGNKIKHQNVPLKVQIAQKLMIDLRFYNDEPISKINERKPLTTLPKSIKTFISDSHLGGIILFSDNLENPEQTIKLNYDLQQAASNSHFKFPLLISVDQEGGRVFRTNRQDTTSFTGNMSIGATYEKYGCVYAAKTAEVIGNELNHLGFNVNHAPTIDVNANPNNPVINVRSFGESPETVAKLGLSQVKAFQKNIISTIKHYPGHGDTDVDSHTSLPVVTHDLGTIYKMDIAPFKYIIENSKPAMIMTAHIQYPALDNSEFITKSGTKVLKPATMSRIMINDILRNELNYQGVIITDALDMAGIANFFSEHDAVINTFKAGVDIALMPIKIRSPLDFNKLEKLIDAIVCAIEIGELDKKEIHSSFYRIQKLKNDYELEKSFDVDISDSIKKAKTQLASDLSRKLEQQLADDAITLVTGCDDILPLKENQKIHLIMPDKTKSITLKHMLNTHLGNKTLITYTNMHNYDLNQVHQQIKNADIVIASHISPKQSAAEMGGMDDLAVNSKISKNVTSPQAVYDLLKLAKKHNKQTMFVSLRTPYEITKFKQVADLCLATYAYNTYIDLNSNEINSPALYALSKVLTGKISAKGVLPVTVNI
ncbi:glycosyl hydrolase family 3 [Pseudoalteromonas sp. NBT06-2]|uniref:glycoside hydrolase family 3 protein n=1 Tax=Pseudoalteromonas sp. NBT06-2 TaxID=2025950 RepID=UPI000BA6BE60|nr:glycoside hydrolase family 3 protein [Pseudoalteromonas sp. NBT06-2]PAJ75253.1 glycosyl hydrolase family 3 [Pseudoalteromonas sp. NBT06-2]